MKIYTKTGDRGETSLVGGIRVAKDSVRLEAYGTVDELSSCIGLLVAMLREKSAEAGEDIGVLEGVQNELFDISTMLATDEEALRGKSNGEDWVAKHLERMAALRKHLPEETMTLERRIDVLTTELPALHTFILPGGSKTAAQCHVCRTVCRRAERRIVNVIHEFTKTHSIREGLCEQNAECDNENVAKYINRLSDYLYVLARKINILYRVEEKTWQNTCK